MCFTFTYSLFFFDSGSWNSLTINTSTVKDSKHCNTVALFRSCQRNTPKRTARGWSAWEDSTRSAKLQVIPPVDRLFFQRPHLPQCVLCPSRPADPPDSCSGSRWAEHWEREWMNWWWTHSLSFKELDDLLYAQI